MWYTVLSVLVYAFHKPPSDWTFSAISCPPMLRVPLKTMCSIKWDNPDPSLAPSWHEPDRTQNWTETTG